MDYTMTTYITKVIRIFIILEQALYSIHREQLRHVATPSSYSSPKETNQTPVLNGNFHIYRKVHTYRTFFYALGSVGGDGGLLSYPHHSVLQNHTHWSLRGFPFSEVERVYRCNFDEWAMCGMFEFFWGFCSESAFSLKPPTVCVFMCVKYELISF